MVLSGHGGDGGAGVAVRVTEAGPGGTDRQQHVDSEGGRRRLDVRGSGQRTLRARTRPTTTDPERRVVLQPGRREDRFGLFHGPATPCGNWHAEPDRPGLERGHGWLGGRREGPRLVPWSGS